MSVQGAGSSHSPRRPPAVPLPVREILKRSIEFLSGKGIDTARLDAERMLAEVLSIDRMEIYLEPERIVKDDERDRLRELVRRRGSREPAQYILNSAGFYGLDILTDPRALIPRRETELLVDRAREIGADRVLNVADIGTGSGCIALALARNLAEGSRIWAADLHDDALALASENAKKVDLSDRITFVTSDLLGGLGEDVPALDLIVANLPYIPSAELETLMPEVRDHEPRSALDGGDDGLDLIRALIAQVPPRLAPGGWILLEVGMGQADTVNELLSAAGLEVAPALRDPADIDRVCQARRAES